MEEYRTHRHILCIDLKSFYASVECSLLGLDPFKTPLVVADKSRGGGSIVLAVTPYLKKMGVPNRLRIHELPKNKRIIYRKPQMRKYLEFSGKVIEIYMKFVAEEDLYVYSVDEAFLDVTDYRRYYDKTDVEIAKMIMNAIYEETKIYSSCGVGPNMLLAKLALDIESKHSPDFLAKWEYEDLEEKLWPVKPLSEMWGIGPNMERNLNRLGIKTVGDLAHYDITKLKKRYGVRGEELYYHANGIDQSKIQNKDKIEAVNKSYGVGQTLFRDYRRGEINPVILEMVDDVCRRLRLSKKQATTVHFGLGYSKHVGGGFSRQSKLPKPSSSETRIYKECLHLLEKFYEGSPIRKVHVSVSGLVKQEAIQCSLFEDVEQIVKEHKVFSAVDEIKYRYGKNKIDRASSELKESTAKKRNELIGGHNAG